jgi:hypothetical protein
MDVKPLEAILSEVGKAFRLCRFYPSSHPSVQQAMAELSAALPALAGIGTIELRISPNGFLLGSTQLGSRNPQLAELAGLMYAQGYRALGIEPGVTSDEVASLIRTISGAGSKAARALGAQTQAAALPHLHLEQAARKYAAPKRESAGHAGPAALSEGPALGRRSTGVFRPDALPPEIEAGRLMTLLEHAAPAEAPRMLERLGEVGADLAAQNDYGLLAKVVLALCGRLEDDGEVSGAARRALERCVADVAVSGLLARLWDPRISAEDRDQVVRALGCLKGRSIPMVVDAFLSASGDEQRDLLAAVVRLAGEAAVLPIESRATTDDRPQAALAHAVLLGATRSPRAVGLLGTLARHGDASVRAAAVMGLARIPAPEASRAVVGALRDPDAGVRAAAARGVAWFGDASLSGIIMARLRDEPDETAAVCLIEALGELREARAVPHLAEVAKGVSGVFQRHPVAVRVAAIRALAAIGTPEVRDSLEAHRSDHSPEVRAAVEEALRAASGPSA